MKPFYRSKVLIFNTGFILVLLSFLSSSQFQDWIMTLPATTAATITMVVAIINIVLRFLTDQPVELTLKKK